jgi:hypothetical protein
MKSTIMQELRVVENMLHTIAGHLEGLANNGFGWTKPDAEAERQRFRAALRENAEQVRQVAQRVCIREE